MDIRSHSSDHPRTGGPSTPEGKAQSRRNALKHGLTASTLLHEVVGDSILEYYRTRLDVECQPRSFLERILVEEMARHGAKLEFARRAEDATLRRGAAGMSVLGPTSTIPNPVTDDEASDNALVLAVTSEALEKVSRYRRSHERAFHRSLTTFQELKDRAAERVAACPYTTEAQCEQYLRERRAGDQPACPRCSSSDGCWLARSKRWQCGHCKHQTGLRAGTVMQRSPLPLLCWFRAIVALRTDPNQPLRQLAEFVGIERLMTVRRMRASIHTALQSPDRSRLLAGLDRPEPS